VGIPSALHFRCAGRACSRPLAHRPVDGAFARPSRIAASNITVSLAVHSLV